MSDGVEKPLSVSDVAAMLGVARSWVYQHTRPGVPDPLPGFRYGKYLRFRREEILAWQERQRIGGAEKNGAEKSQAA